MRVVHGDMSRVWGAEVETPPQEVTPERDSPTKHYLVFTLCFTHKTGS